MNHVPANSRRAPRMAFLLILLCLGTLCNAQAADFLDLSSAVVVIRPGELHAAEKTAAIVLVEEVEKRAGIRLPVSTEFPEQQTAIAITAAREVPVWSRPIPASPGEGAPESRPEGFRLYADLQSEPATTVWVLGADARGALFGVGALLRNLDWANGQLRVSTALNLSTSPAYSIRGHQIGYRTAANSWDAWTPEQFEQYFRELAFFGINSIENIPFQDDRPTPVMRKSRAEMNRRMSEICQRYGLDYWVWTPADFDLKDAAVRSKALDTHEAFYKDCPTLSGVFFPGGDPGDNPPELVMPFLEDIAKRLLPIHPDARVWLSLQGFKREQCEYVLAYLERESPDWLGGIVTGPSSPPIPLLRNALPAKYKHRLYPDLTHNKICQYPVPGWDQAYALTLGREAINPRPMHYSYIHNWFASYSDGFISYSDGVHDDVNKTIWSAMSWNPDTPVRDVLVEYARVFFGPEAAEAGADGILALENNWRGPLAQNSSVEGVLLQWQALEAKLPELAGNWRWQMCLTRAYYDTYVRRRLLAETELERKANTILEQAASLGAQVSMEKAAAVLNEAVLRPAAPELRARIVTLCEEMYHSIGLQTSVDKYHAIGAERGAILDMIDYPLNNRWWLEDEFKKVAAMASEPEKCARLRELASWETPGPGSFYDDVGHPGKSPHVKRSEFVYTEPGEEAHPEPVLWWWDNGQSRARLSWQTSMNYPEAMVYEGLDPNAQYVVRCGGYGKFLMRIDGELVPMPKDKVEMGEHMEFAVPAEALADRKVVLTWDMPMDEGHLNWRQHSRLAEVWLVKK